MPLTPEELAIHNMKVEMGGDLLVQAAKARAGVVWACLDVATKTPLWYVKGYDSWEEAIDDNWRDHL